MWLGDVADAMTRKYSSRRRTTKHTKKRK